MPKLRFICDNWSCDFATNDDQQLHPLLEYDSLGEFLDRSANRPIPAGVCPQCRDLVYLRDASLAQFELRAEFQSICRQWTVIARTCQQLEKDPLDREALWELRTPLFQLGRQLRRVADQIDDHLSPEG